MGKEGYGVILGRPLGTTKDAIHLVLVGETCKYHSREEEYAVVNLGGVRGCKCIPPFGG